MKTQKKIEPINVYAKDESAEYTHLVISRKVNELVDAYNDSVEAAQSLKGVNPFPLFLADKDKNMTYLKQLFTYLSRVLTGRCQTCGGDDFIEYGYYGYIRCGRCGRKD